MATTAGVVTVDASKIQELLSKSRTRGVYDEKVTSFAASGEAGIGYSTKEGEFAGKQTNSLVTGFKSAIERLLKNENADNREALESMQVVPDGENVFIIRKDLVGA